MVKKHAVILLFGGIAALMVAMGVGRFAFTPILPMMLEEHLISPAHAGYLASSNYLGYLVGAIALTIYQPKRLASFLLVGLLISVLTTWGMAEFNGLEVWMLLRFLSGAASAAVFILTSNIVLEYLSPFQTGFLYGAVGLGILLTGIFVPVFAQHGDSFFVWKGLGLLSLILGVIAWFLLKQQSSSNQIPKASSIAQRQESVKQILVFIIIAYSLEGLGYIVTGTYLVAYVKSFSSITNISSLSWVLVGIAAAPSCLIWSILASKIGHKKSLILAMILQAIGIAIPVIVPSLASVYVGALLFGATFMGITTLSIAFVKHVDSKNSRKLVGLLTAFFGLGQIIGPLIAGFLISGAGNYNTALVGAALVVLLGAMILQFGIRRPRYV
ncbi:YbfB/YjiJ family MFS transporter [Paenibacillus psychroresistens]|uniref:YbfB/YjiJ family MFS transporter n=1 Tax=Paenibacillus psychroresistens TaxID=1778678 RepID=A0A6B8RT88_9BACL|nr:YbfB/YjiJ family MFS transporter [Paenibacillus psychroresistens]QGQ99129.1 YbfB/YjiJ family MFS transporter [Paenibacillus psychroresistens]